ncbi:MAG TPA: hypothetical protein VNC39_06650 [Acidocella sp.]|jgi:hypothetical protein|uniref:hypothetical protein n=1 Tax=Acidocella sp. TaxID=50710 RepID=UPI002B5E39EA|nr:hypothetical protein [Acidocella sp.]HVE21638.1 hypothetical protein [Acidocella sp.]
MLFEAGAYDAEGRSASDCGVKRRQAEGKATFCEQKAAKKLCYAGPWALAPSQPMAQHKQKFLVPLFSKKRPLACF